MGIITVQDRAFWASSGHMKLDIIEPRSRSVSIQHCWGIEEGDRCPKASTRARHDAAVTLAGVAIASSCQIVLPIFGTLFFIVGLVLTIASYRGRDADEEPERYEDRVSLTRNLRILGPCCMVVGFIMSAVGLGLFLASRRKKLNDVTFHCPIHGDFYPLSASQASLFSLKKRSSLMCSLDVDLNMPTPQCPHSQRSSVSNGPPQQHSPLPPVISSNEGLLTPNNLLHLGEYSGSTQSLAPSYDVASFPHSRSTSPGPGPGPSVLDIVGSAGGVSAVKGDETKHTM